MFLKIDTLFALHCFEPEVFENPGSQNIFTPHYLSKTPIMIWDIKIEHGERGVIQVMGTAEFLQPYCRGWEWGHWGNCRVINRTKHDWREFCAHYDSSESYLLKLIHDRRLNWKGFRG